MPAESMDLPKLPRAVKTRPKEAVRERRARERELWHPKEMALASVAAFARPREPLRAPTSPGFRTNCIQNNAFRQGVGGLRALGVQSLAHAHARHNKNALLCTRPLFFHRSTTNAAHNTNAQDIETEYAVSPNTPLLSTEVQENAWVFGE